MNDYENEIQEYVELDENNLVYEEEFLAMEAEWAAEDAEDAEVVAFWAWADAKKEAEKAAIKKELARCKKGERNENQS
jgi:hypothetical protein